jgi:hypothetical protein
MRKLATVGVGVLSLMIVAGLWAADKVPEVAEIMEKAHQTKKGLRAQIEAEGKKPKPDWDALQKKTKEYAELAEALPKNEPPKGDKKSWEKLAKEFAAEVKSLDEAAKKKNAKDLLEVNKKLGAKCDNCHDAHQP